MSIEEARAEVVKAFGLQALCFPESYPLEQFDEMQEARIAAFANRDTALDRLIIEVRAAMPCSLSIGRGDDEAPPYCEVHPDDACPAHAARAELAEKVPA